MNRSYFRRYLVPLVFIALIPACAVIPTEEPPGVGERAEKGYAASQPVIAALESYKLDHGSYPESLIELVPDYLSSVPAKTEELDFFYSRTETGYQFSFYYLGPGMNACTYAPEAKDWKCSGAY